jgi:4-hydroxy-3-methylbut-2-enyl diphosphate reductase
MKETVELAKYIRGEKSAEQFYVEFDGRFSHGFDATKDLQRVGVVNQTTQLATDTQSIADFLKQTMKEQYGLTEENISERFADTRDTLCYATNDNQSAAVGMLSTNADLAIVAGGYNSSNTTHLVELCEEKLPTYFIQSEDNLISAQDILHYNFHSKQELLSSGYLPQHQPATLLLTSGASCPDAVVENVIRKLASFFRVEGKMDELTSAFIDRSHSM